MALSPRLLLIAFAAWLLAVGLTALALSVMIEETEIGFDTVLPRSAMLAPMIGVVAFWGVARALSVPLNPIRVFVIGALLVYGLLYLLGRVVAVTQIDTMLGLATGALVTLVAAYVAVLQADQSSDQS